MSTPYDQLNTCERLPLEIEGYKEQAAAWKHEDNLFQRFTSVMLPLSIAALGLPYVQKVPVLLATIGGLMLMTFWIISCQIMRIKSKVRLSIIRKLEKTWKIKGHEDFQRIRKSTYGKKLGGHFLRCCMYWVYLSISIALYIIKTRFVMCPDSYPIGVEIVVALLVGLANLVVFFAMCKARKDPPENGN